MPNHAKPSQTTHNYYWEHIESFKTIFQKNLKKTSREEDESSIKSRLNKQQALEATKKPRVANTRIHFQQILTQFRI